MKKPIKSDADLETTVGPLVAAMKVSRLCDACRILFVSGESLTLSAELEQIGIVALEGVEVDNVEGADLLVSQSQLQLTKIAQEVLPKLLQRLFEPIVEATVGVASIQNEEERKAIFVAKIVERVQSQDEAKEFGKSLTPYIGGAIKPFAELLIGSLYKFYYERHKAQRQLVADFDKIVTSLKRLGLLAPFLSLAVCPACNNYDLVFSRSAKFSPNCAQCGSRWPVLTVSEFQQPFAVLKKKSKDLPVFISAYLKSKSPLPVEVFPNAEFSLPKGKVEVDVFIPDTATGMECKCYVNNIAVTASTISSEAGKIKQQIDNYLATGITRVFVITNLNDVDARKLNIQLRDQLKSVKGLHECEVLSADMMKFARLLDEEANRLGEAVNKRWQQELEHRVRKQLVGQSKEEDSQ